LGPPAIIYWTGDAATGAGTNIDETAAVAERSCDGIDDDGDFGQRFLNGGGYLRVFVVNDPRDFEGRLGVESFGSGVGGLRREIVEFQWASVDGFRCGGLLKHGKGSHKYPANPAQFILFLRLRKSSKKGVPDTVLMSGLASPIPGVGECCRKSMKASSWLWQG
jgi:hypothetical protein